MTKINNKSDWIFGVDFDNTIVDYDDLVLDVAHERQLLPRTLKGGKKFVRDAIRTLPNGEVEWQKVQALVYGPRMLDSTVAKGVKEFLRVCSDNQISVLIVSHKTEFADYDETNTSLHDMARQWINRNLSSFVTDLNLACLKIFFEPTRQEKLERISDIRCTHFIDDLEETFSEKSFPDGVAKILYSPDPGQALPLGVNFSGNWLQISNYLFNDSN